MHKKWNLRGKTFLKRAHADWVHLDLFLVMTEKKISHQDTAGRNDWATCNTSASVWKAFCSSRPLNGCSHCWLEIHQWTGQDEQPAELHGRRAGEQYSRPHHEFRSFSVRGCHPKLDSARETGYSSVFPLGANECQRCAALWQRSMWSSLKLQLVTCQKGQKDQKDFY